jgi:hypothetical protein
MSDFSIKRGDREPSISATLKQNDVVIDLTGSTVKFIMTTRDGTAKVSASAVIVTPLQGLVRYDWQLADTDTQGHYIAEWEITLPTGRKLSVPTEGYASIEVVGDLG